MSQIVNDFEDIINHGYISEVRINKGVCIENFKTPLEDYKKDEEECQTSQYSLVACLVVKRRL